MRKHEICPRVKYESELAKTAVRRHVYKRRLRKVMSWNHFTFSVLPYIRTQYICYNAMKILHFVSHFTVEHISCFRISQLAAT